MKVYKFLSKSFLLIILAMPLFSQNKIGINQTNPEVALDIKGKLKMGVDNFMPVLPGTMRFDSSRFEGWDGMIWTDFAPDPRETFWPQNGDVGSTGLWDPHSMTDAVQNDQYGYSVAMDGDFAVVGSPGWEGNRGRVIVYQRLPYFGTWSLVSILTSPSGITDERFGHSVSISGNRILIGAPDHMDATLSRRLGQVYFFKRNGSTWSYEGTIPNSYCRVEKFGFDVKIQGSEGIISAPEVSSDPACLTPVNRNKGEVFYFDLNNGFFVISTLFSPIIGTSGFAKYGYSIDIDGDWIVIGAPYSQSATNREDSIYIFHRDAIYSYQWNYYQAFEGYAFDSEVGRSVAIKGQNIYVGEPKYDQYTNDNKGAIRKFILNTVTNMWEEIGFRFGEDDNGEYGHSVSSGLNYTIAAAYTDPVNYGVLIQTYDNNLRNYVQITDPLTTSFDLQVSEVSISGKNFIIGLPNGMSENGQLGGRIFFGKIR